MDSEWLLNLPKMPENEGLVTIADITELVNTHNSIKKVAKNRELVTIADN